MIRDHPPERTRSGTRLLTGFETYILNRINDGSAGSGLIDTLPFHVAVAARELFGAVASFERACIPEGGRVVFNIKANDYRLIAIVQYRDGVLILRFFGNHEDYEKVNAETV
ncbi:hypothetical protein BKD09_36015 [Bradyrhizobium japonicum]|uniref:Type II toxin-antitoxin system HigB family toxin n=2 Tax=Bradyrhizobium TaxID=374 RepID=A0A9X9XT37_9BRAD|nr:MULTISPECIES: type II toxin-antitoxin system HigB family toxin [Bradyrhizobium]APG13777.1 hypothetical protein BKD09_36015 [Bradyrhizobium japonicum]UEM10831.1 type II toxin-antitoxin system HigB family toxin [Bradyrhizobium barranii subsp. barranii]